METLLAISTYRRKEKLAKLLESLFHSTYKNYDIVIICDDNDIETAKEISELNDYPFLHSKVMTIIQDKKSFVVANWNRAVKDIFIKGTYQYFIGLCDDVVLYPDALQNIGDCHKRNFSDTDGAVGFKQVLVGCDNYNFKWYGQMLLGRKWIERYKEVGYTYYCPAYKHFYADQELYEYASSLDKFKECHEAVLEHFHPDYCGNPDEAHNAVRLGPNSPKRQDIATFKDRQTRNLIWGKSWEI